MGRRTEVRASRWLTYGRYMCSSPGAADVSGPSRASCAPVTAGLAVTERVSMFALVTVYTVMLLLYILAI